MSLKYFPSIFILILVVVTASASTTTWTSSTKTVCDKGICYTENYPYIANYYNGTVWNMIDQDIKDYSDLSLSIAGRDYKYGNTDGLYYMFFREQSSDVVNRPVAILTGELNRTNPLISNYIALTYSPGDFIKFEPHKPTTQGKVGNRQQSFAEIDGYKVTYPDQYKRTDSPSGFANLTYMYVNEYVKEEYYMWNKGYIQDRFERQCKPEEINRTKLVFPTTIRAYVGDDADLNTLGIIYGKDRIKFKDYGDFIDGELLTNESIEFTDANNNTILRIPQIYVWDTNDTDHTPFDENRIKIVEKRLKMTRFGNLDYEALVPVTWIFNESYMDLPFILDPYTEFNSTNNDLYWNGNVHERTTLPTTYPREPDPLLLLPANMKIYHTYRAGVAAQDKFYRSVLTVQNMSLIPHNAKILNASVRLHVIRQCSNDGNPCWIKFTHMRGNNDTYPNNPADNQGNELFWDDMHDGAVYNTHLSNQYATGAGYWYDLNESFWYELETRRYLQNNNTISIGFTTNMTDSNLDRSQQNYRSMYWSTVSQRPRLNITWRIDGCKPPLNETWKNNESCTFINEYIHNNGYPYQGLGNDSITLLNATINVSTWDWMFPNPLDNLYRLLWDENSSIYG